MDSEKVEYFRSQREYLEFIYTENSTHSFPLHNHVSSYTVGLILDGELAIKRPSGLIRCQADDFFIVPPYEAHAIFADRKFTMISVSIRADFVMNYGRNDVARILLDMAKSLLQKGLLKKTSIHILADAVDMLYCSIVCYHESDAEKERLKEQFRLLSHQETSLEELSKSVFMSKYHFLREFKKSIGLPPHQFQLQNRIRCAQHMLADKRNISMTEIALRTGFCDQSHFTKSFERLVGISPSQYRESQNMLDE